MQWTALASVGRRSWQRVSAVRAASKLSEVLPICPTASASQDRAGAVIEITNLSTMMINICQRFDPHPFSSAFSNRTTSPWLHTVMIEA